MKAKEIIKIIENICPERLAYSWDNVGLLCGDENKDVKKVFVTLDTNTNAVKEAQDQELLDFTARRLMEMAADIIMCHLLIQDASKAADLFSKSAHVYLNFAEAEVTKQTNFIKNMDKEDLAFYKK